MADSSQYSISSLLAYWHAEVVPALATAVTLDHAFPQEVLNELRNAMTHMGRANALDPAQHAEAIQKELHSAHRHLLRCTLDCLKVVLLAIAKKCESHIRALDEELLLPASVHAEARALRNRRVELSKHEGQNPINNVVESLKALCDDYDKFSQKIETEFSGDVVASRRRARRLHVWKERGWGGLLGVIASAVVAIAAWKFLPPA